MFPLWSTEKLESQGGNTAVSAVGSSHDFTVPSGEIWVPLSLGGWFAVTTIGDTLGMGLFMTNPSLTVVTRLDPGAKTISTTNNEVLQTGFQFPQRIAFPPGWKFGSLCTEYAVAAGARLLAFQMIYYKLDI